jgi:uncharacterized DUF497 family protein
MQDMKQIDMAKCTGFDWDEGNQTKNEEKHNVSIPECEQVFLNHPLLLYEDLTHSIQEDRHFVLGQTNHARYIFLVFTIRKNLIRVISARDMNKKERIIYEKAIKENT